ncbi:major facilitator superfamily domain-containing protein [Cercophora newfieldiana]|uniref:Major facilitator superfamily domain-containing protein n=1 Tax=Cercophora newfieldiana TaxID=92897 RepID=A0AA39YFV0_9PEZI|nr:major facilitator superfamily domain-containing protein [Cercophora newfieldiana]
MSETQTIQLRNGHDPQSDESPMPILPPISRKKQAAVLFSAFGSLALTIGYNQCFGIFQEYYLSDDQDVLIPSPASQSSPPTALLAFVGTLCYGLTWAGGILVNPIIPRIEHGKWDATPSTRLWRRRALRLLRPRTGFLAGMGMSLLYFPVLAPAPEYFTKHRATAMGFILAGGGAGGLLLTFLLRALLTTLGGRWTLRVYALLNLVLGLPIAYSVPPSRFSLSTSSHASIDHPRRNTHVSRALAVRSTFILSSIAAFLQAAGAQLPLSFIPSYSVGLGLSASKGANFLAAANAINAVSRIFTGYIGDRVGRQNTLIITLLFAAVSVFTFWLGSILTFSPSHPSGSGQALWYAFIAFYSSSIGGYYGLFPAFIADVFGIRQYAAVNAFVLFVRGLGTMFGSPVGGQLLGSHGGKGGAGIAEYERVVYWDGALLMAATVCCVGVRWADAKGKGWRWVA